MAVYKNESNGTWYVMIWYTDWTGKRKQKCKRGFKREKDAKEWEMQFKLQKQSNPNMTLESFYEMYEKDVKPTVKLNTWKTKDSYIRSKVLPYLGKRKLSEITAKDIVDWQNEVRKLPGSKKGTTLAAGTLKTIHGELSALFNHAVRYYGLHENPARVAGGMGEESEKEMEFWIQDEYKQFIEEVMDKPISYYAFELLYWCGIREGDADGKISLNQQKPSKHAGLRRFGPEKFLQRNNEFMKERPIFYKKPIKTEKDFSTWLRCFYYTTKAVITEYTYF